jgi:hypothetical protein
MDARAQAGEGDDTTRIESEGAGSVESEGVSRIKELKTQ